MYDYCVKSFDHNGCNMIVCTGGTIWFNPFATMLFNVCSAVTEECCVLYPYCVGVFGMLCKEEGSSSMSLLLRRGGIWDIRCMCLCLC